MQTRHAIITLMAGALLTPAARAQYTIPWSTIDSGANLMVGGDYAMRGTFAQHDAGPPEGPASGAGYTLSGGFWQPPLLDPSCNPADIAEPYGFLDLADISVFIVGFTTMDPIADLAPPFGVYDLADVGTFIAYFTAGCP